MRVLLDTHVYLWWLADDRRLGDDARDVIADANALVHVSAASVWEAESKASLHRLDTGGADLVDEIDANGFLELPLTAAAARRAAHLPQHHRDPFDRALVAQAQAHGLTLMTADQELEIYGVEVFPA